MLKKASRKIKIWYAQYEHYISPVALIGGFIFDNLTLQRIDMWIENAVILAYLVIAFFCILFLSAYEAGLSVEASAKAGRLQYRIFERISGLMPFTLQFVFGGLFSAFFIFYSRSSSFIIGWPFLLILAFLLIGNELFKKRYERMAFRLSIFFMTIFSYSVFALPVFLKKMGAGIFLLSGLASLILIGFIVLAVKKTAPLLFKKSRTSLAISIGSIYILFHIFYFFNLIPPIPLSLKDSGIYHNIVRNANGYEVQLEPAPWYLFYREYDSVFHWASGKPVYCYTAIFAPTEISADIFHRWSYFDEEANGWINMGKIGFSVVGGRDGGYRGYTLKYNVKPGKWRVDVITDRDQILGRVNFEIIEAGSMPELQTEMR